MVSLTRRKALAVLALLVFIAAPLTGQPTAQAASPCPDYQEVEFVGWVCPEDNGLLRIPSADGADRYTHGVDSPEPDTAEALESAADPPVCTESRTGYYHHVIYARAHDRPDDYARREGDIREIVEHANGLLNSEAKKFAWDVQYRMLCASGTVVVENEALPTSDADSTFSTIVEDLEARGYTDGQAKYWVWYDTGTSGCRGVGHIYDDDRPGTENWNNGNGAPLFGVTWGCTGTSGIRVMMHENGHNMGAVQDSAPDTSGGGHCNDGQDIMCYNDGGSNSSYDRNACSDHTHFDCDHDSYYHPDPPSGSYLDTHWNLGSGNNRFVVREPHNPAPVVQSFSCGPEPSLTGDEVTCTFTATDDGTALYYTLDWGDGTSQRVPESGTVAPGTAVSAAHVFTAPNDHTLTLTATDTGDPVATSEPALWVQTVIDESSLCDLDRQGRLLVGAPLARIEGINARWERALDPGCGGKAYVLTSGSIAEDFDICWYDGSTRLRCDQTFGDEQGTIPLGATDARILFYSGADGHYRLRLQ